MSRQTDNFYNKFSFFYPLADLFLKPQKCKLFEEINKLPPGELLEIGVGNGKHLPLCKTHKITAIDTSSGMLETARKQKTENIEFLQMNGEDLLFPDKSFDYVVLSHVIAVVDNPERLLTEIFRVLKPGGKVFILNHFTPPNWLGYVDKSLQGISKILHFKSLFYIDSLSAIKKFKLLKEIRFGQLSYFKLLIYGKL
jgi:phosphatidylethanolamine/phosphatidyl-N-methylethanolamine N-methyltransferase